MAIFKPFKAVRPIPEKASEIAALPYDVMNSEEAKEMVVGKPYSFLHVDKAEIDFDPIPENIYTEEIYLKAKENLGKLVEDGVAKQDETPATSITTGDISSQNIKLTAKATYLNFAVPAGNFTTYRIIVTGTDDNTYSLTAPSLSIQRAMVNKLPAALNAGALFVNGHKVTVKFSEDAGIENDVLTNVKVDGSNVIIRAISFQDLSLVCSVGDNAQCVRTRINNKFTFTISGIQSDIEAVLAYAPLVTLTVTSDGNGKVWIGDDKNKTSGQYQFGYQVEIHAEPDDNFRLFRWNDNNRETTRTITVGDTDVEYRASFISANMIPGLFTVNSSNKQVFLSKGNLYYDGNENKYCFEANQYDIPPLSSVDDNIKNETESHIGHFYWSKNETVARSLSHYSDSEASVSDVFFTNDSSDPTKPNSSFTVSGQTGVWRVLSGKNDGEWKYLLDSRKTAYGSGVLSTGNRHYAMVKVNNMAGLLIFPDDFSSWPSGAGSEPTVFDTYSSNMNNRNYTVAEFTVLQNNGCVFLPEAGNRDGDPNYSYPASVLNVGSYGYYWSSTPYYSNIAYVTIFRSDLVDSSNHDYWHRAHAVRLVTDAK